MNYNDLYIFCPRWCSRIRQVSWKWNKLAISTGDLTGGLQPQTIVHIGYVQEMWSYRVNHYGYKLQLSHISIVVSIVNMEKTLDSIGVGPTMVGNQLSSDDKMLHLQSLLGIPSIHSIARDWVHVKSSKCFPKELRLGTLGVVSPNESGSMQTHLSPLPVFNGLV